MEGTITVQDLINTLLTMPNKGIPIVVKINDCFQELELIAWDGEQFVMLFKEGNLK